tara:strand:+ start:471 stop:809 length:339 start_codon:yes stop_codon:yes gene_type:complete
MLFYLAQIDDAIFKYIVGGMALGLIALAGFTKWIISIIITKFDEWLTKVLATLDSIQKSIVELNTIEATNKVSEEAFRRELRLHMKETKYSIANINKKLNIDPVEMGPDDAE